MFVFIKVNIIPDFVKTSEELISEKGYSWEEAIDEAEAIVIHGDKIIASLDKEIEEGLPQFAILR